ncbi:hemagglutinin repeat-containing protein [Kosakonia sacchari]|uniref:hemagglutinin repeat-containing protein n=1 Tax=Kosakonia sacchari TaxID=1158459 RepID=UPI002ACED5C7|nr:hemagglutinin repeat-containing protein [Kosakonia sacchari]MDZ7322635.1 hemagglutinin repeat-containing protein [Kosakonia sacchari]
MNTDKPVRFSQRALSWLIIGLLVWQPVAPSFAAAITPTGPATMDKAGNGVPVVNIATPNGAGISHNQFNEYNVGQQGLILNNATGQLNQTQLGGLIQNNPNLKAGQEAKGIINEVTGGSRSQLQGYTEVAGKAANVMVANPYGITCNGCGFINTPNATLTTGKPQFDAAGNLSTLEVTKGTITVEGQGLNASGSDALSLISRATEVNAAIHAKNLTVTTGANRVDASGKATAIAGEGAAPVVAVDTGALGGMYANRIHLVSTEKGVGVNLGNLAARQGDITLDANGKMTVRESVASGSLTAKGDGVTLTGSHKAGGDIAVNSTQDMALNTATLAADGKLTLAGAGNTTLTASKIAAGQTALSAKQINGDAASQLSAAGNVTLDAQGISWQGELTAGGNSRITADKLDNAGTITAKGQLTATTGNLNNSGTLQGQALEINSQTAQNSGTLMAARDTRITAGQLDNQGTIAAKNQLTASASTLNNSGTLQGQSLGVTGDALHNSGSLLSEDDTRLTVTRLDNQGTVAAKGQLMATTSTLNNGGTLQGQTLTASGDVVQNNGTLAADNSLSVKAGALTTGNGSTVTAKGDVTLTAQTTADIGGQVNAGKALSVKAADLQTRQQAQLQSGSDLTLTVAGSATLNGTHAAKGTLSVTAKSVSHGGKSNASAITLTAPGALNNSGTLVADTLSLGSTHITSSGLLQGTQALNLQTDWLENLTGGTLYSAKDLTLAIPQLNNSGLITTDGDLHLHGNSLTSSGELNGVNLFSDYTRLENSGRLLADNTLSLTADDISNRGVLAAKNTGITANTLSNTGSVQGDDALTLNAQNTTNSGALATAGMLNLSGQTLDNQGNLSATTLLLTLAQQVNNAADGRIVADDVATLNAPQLSNSGLIAAKNLMLNSADITSSGTLQGTALLTASGTTLTNQQGGLLLSNGAVSLKNDRLNNAGQIQGDTLNLATGQWMNTGTALGQNGLTATVSGTLDNQGQVVSRQAMTLTADNSTNSGALMAKVLALHGDLHSSGLIQGTDGLTWDGNTLTTTADGQLVSGGSLALQGNTLDNAGRMQGKTLTATADSLHNSGTVQAQDALNVQVTGTLANQGQMLSQGQADIRAAQLNNDGTLAANDLVVTASDIISNGILQGNHSLTFATQSLFNGHNGQLASGGLLALNLGTLENQGLLYVQDALTLHAGKLVNSGSLEADALDITSDSTLDNSGTLLAHHAALLRADALGNSGQIAGNAVSLTGNTLTNSGLIQGAQQAQAHADSIINTASGNWLSGGALTFDGGSLRNAGTLQGETVSLTGTTLDNSNIINGLHGLSGVYSGALTSDGQMVSGGVTDLRADAITSAGRITGDTLTLTAATLTSNGLLQGTNGLRTDAATLVTGANSRTLSGGDFTLNAGQLNTGGTLQGGRVSVTADDWTLGGSLLSQGSLNADVAGTLALPGALTSQDAMTLRAQTLNNDGQLLSAGDITLRGQQLTNNGSVQGKTLSAHEGRITNNGTLTGLDSLALDNSQATATLMARMAMVTPQLELINAGSLLTQGTLDITAGSVNNTGTWQGNNILLAAQSLDNRGAIQSAGALTLQLAGNLTSAAGSKITAMGTAALQALALTNNGQWAAKNLTISAGSLSNGGAISGSDGLTATLTGTFTQQAGGQLAGNGALNLTAQRVDNAGNIQGGGVTVSAETLTNNAGAQLVSAQGLTLTTPQLLNYGLIQGAGDTRITAATQARNEGKLLSGGTLTLTAPQYSGAGWLQATDLILNAANNAATGTLLADRMTLTGDTFTNQGTTQANDLTLNYRQLTNNGTLLGSRQLTVNAAQVNQSAAGRLFSGGDLFVGATGLNALGQIVALGNLTLQLADTFTGKTALAAGKTLSVTSNGAIDNQSVMQGQAVNLSAGGQLTNNGQITTGSGASTLSGSAIVLNGNSSLQGGGDVTLASRGNITANGFAGTLGSLTLSASGSIVNTALLYAANNLALYAGSITNQRGDMLAGNNLRLQRDAAGNANTEVVNTSGNIETRNGDITINTGHLLNQRDGLNANSVTTTHDLIAGIGEQRLNLYYSQLPDGTYGLFSTNRTVNTCETQGGSCSLWNYTTINVAPLKEYTDYKFVLSETRTDVTSSGGSSRIASGRNMSVAAGIVDNRASEILSTGNMALQGTQLNNQSWQNSITTDAIVYKYASDTYASSPYTGGPIKEHNSNLISYNLTIPYILQGHEITTTQGQLYRAVIQAGGNVSANFSSNISNTSTTANAGGVSGTITAPSLNTLSNQSIGGSVAKQTLAAGSVSVNSPQWQDQLHNALQQINGGGALDNASANGAALANIGSQQKGSASLGSAGSLTNAGVTSAALKNTSTGALDAHQGKSVDTSAYPLPSGNNGYFVVSANPKSPYLITVNPKLDGLGQLDPNLFGDLNKLLGVTPSAAPRETSSTYTDEKQFLGSAYMLDRIKLNPDHDYRFLGDAAFDTRYVSNVVLNQTGNRYLNGIGSDLAQMQYLMDNAANAQQPLGLQFGVALNADQIAALDHSILWWESATINGETVLIPKVYLSPKDVTVNNGSVIAGNNVSLEGGSVANTGGTLLARNNLSVESDGAITNSNDALMKAGGNVSLSAIGDISNLSSTISGKTVALESLDGSINNVTLADQFALDAKSKYGSVSLKNTTLGTIASITASDGLSLAAGKDITLTGATLKAGGDLLMDAGGNIAVNAIQKNDAYSQSGFNAGYLRQTATGREQVSYQGSGITAGGNLGMQAGNDLTLSASDVSAGKDAKLSAGHDLNLDAQQTSNNTRNGKSESHSTGLDRTTVSAGNNLILTAGQDINSHAAGLAAEQQVGMQAGRDINLLAEATTQGDSYKASKKTVINEQVRQQGTEIASGTGTTILAGRDMNAEAAQVNAKGDIGVQAGRNVNLTTATESDYHYKEETKTKSGFLSKTKTHTISEQSATREAGTLLSGDNVTVKSGHDLLVKGSSVVGDGDVALSAVHNVDITAATNTDSNWQFKEKKKSGLMGSGGIGFTIGSSKTKQDLKEKGTTQSQSMSTVGSNGGDVTVTAGNQLHVGGSDLIAKNDLALSGDSVVVDPGHDKRTTDQKFEQKSSGLTVALTGAVVDAVNNAVTTAQAASKQSDSRLAALQATKSVLSGYQAVQGKEMADTTGEPDSGIHVSISLTTQKSKSEQHQVSDQVSGSTLNAGNDLTIKANGKNHEANSGDIVIAGSSMKAGGDTSLDAARDILLTGAANTQKTTGSNSSSGGGVGVSFGVGQGGAGLSVFANVNAAKGNEKGDGTNWTETTLDSGGKVSLRSGQDASLIGAQVSGDQVTADIGRNLTVTSLQDSNNYDSKQSSVSAGGSFTFGSMTGSGYINFSQDKMHSTFDSVAEQSGIFAGKGGFDVTVGNHTQLNGGAIGSTATADKNSLDTGTLGYGNIINKADYKVSHSGGGFSSSGNLMGQGAINAASTLMSSVGSSGHASGTTEAAVSEGSITVRDTANQHQDVSGLQRDVTKANDAISPIFNKEKEQNRLQAVQMVSDIGNQVADIVRTQSDIDGLKAAMAKTGTSLEGLPEKERLQKLAELRNTPEYKHIAENTGTGSDVQRAITAATAAVSGLAGGNINAALAGAAAPYIASEIGKNITENNTMAGIMAHAVVNAVLAKVQGQDALVGASGAVVGEATGILLAKQVYGKDPSQLTETEKQTIAALSTLASGLAGGLIGDSTETATAAAKAGKTTVENNYLYADEDKAKTDLERKLPYLKGEEKEKAQAEIDRWKELSEARNKAIDAACHQLTSEQCGFMRKELALAGQSYEGTLKKDDPYYNYLLNKYKDQYDGQKEVISLQFELAVKDAKAFEEFKAQNLATGLSISIEAARMLVLLEHGANSALTLAATAVGMKAPAGVDIKSPSLIESETAALERIKQNGLNTVNLNNKEPNTVYNQQLAKEAEKAGFLSAPQAGGTLNIGAGNRPISGAYNISSPDYPMANGVHAGDANDLSQIASGSQSKIVMENPYGFEPFGSEIQRVLASDGVVLVTGTWSNPEIRNIEKIATKNGFILTEKKILQNSGYTQSDGITPINNKTVTEYSFKRK